MTEKGNLIKTMALAANMRLDTLPPELKWQGAVGAEQWRRIAEASEKGEPTCWNSFCSSPEIFYAMDLPAIMQEGFGAATVSFPGKLNEKYIDIAHENLVAEHVCSTQKVMIGAALCGDLPLPSAIAYVDQPCDSTQVTYATIAERLGIPLFTLDMPGGKDERTVQYVADEIERMVAFLEKHTGKKLEYDKLREAMEYSNIACDYNLKTNELSKMIPSPVPSPTGGGLVSSAGTPEGVEFYKKIYEMAKAVVESGKGYTPDQRVRVGWFSTGVAYDPQLASWMHQEFGTITVNSLLGTFTTPPAQDISSMRKIIEALARKQMDAPMHRECGGSLDAWFDYAIPTCRDWKIDVVVMTAHIGCKNVWAVHKLFKDKMADELGIPTLIVEADFCDARPFPAEGIKAQISDFFNTIMV